MGSKEAAHLFQPSPVLFSLASGLQPFLFGEQYFIKEGGYVRPGLLHFIVEGWVHDQGNSFLWFSMSHDIYPYIYCGKYPLWLVRS
ncbi:hypothetical protein [Leclercia adecarboxylata]|uniref:hypothetical protein n=1 Tax=Leclercia adecarboxylata TaxID=83655 RepID=UPI001F49EF45|nr:hypothetical protein [Leclercia adecarboxylata]